MNHRRMHIIIFFSDESNIKASRVTNLVDFNVLVDLGNLFYQY